jgi:hypothetical protein
VPSRGQLVWLFVLAACDPLADATYRGEPLARVRGRLEDLPPIPPETVVVSLVWGSCPEPVTLGESSLCIPDAEAVVDLAGGARTFELPLYEQPPAGALLGPPGAQAAIGRFVLSDRPLRDRAARVLGGGRHFAVTFNQTAIPWDPTIHEGEGPPGPGYALWEDLSCQTWLLTGTWPTGAGIRYRLVPFSEGVRVWYLPGEWPLGC